ncbi:MAG: putative DNA binding domain-containing protein [Bacteroidales bacterium]|jgi:predicted HTH transcriptional regulator|nr:putative DNA binding domain-containing protein [Bacteroidales bacterium]
MTQSLLQNIINGGENISVEFKQCSTELNPAVYETVCSFLNRTGGYLILGVADDGHILGVNVNCIDSMIKNLINTVNNPELLNPTFYFSPEVFTIENKKVISIYIPESSQVHRYKGKIYDRVGDADNNITNNHYLINNIYLRKNREFTENEVLPFLEISDLSSDTFRKARQLAGVLNDSHPWLTMNESEILHACGLWRKDNQSGKEGYTLAAALLFGKGRKNIRKYAPYYYGNYKIDIENGEKFVFSITYRDTDEKVKESDKVLIGSNTQLDRIYTIIGDNVSDNVKEHLVTIIKTLYIQPKQNRIDLIAQTKIKNPTLDRYIKILKNANIIEFVRPDKTGGYYLTETTKEKLVR